MPKPDYDRTVEALPQPHVEVETAPKRMLPGGRNKVERLSAQTRGLAEDMKSWVELRIKLLQAEIQDRIQSKVNESIIKIAPALAAALTGLFALVTIALFLGWWLGHPAWGYLVVTALLALATGGLLARKKRFEAEQKTVTDRSENGAAGRTS